MKVWCEISESNLKHNLDLIRSIIGDKKLLIMLKSRSYGYGLIPIAKFCKRNGVDYIGIDSVQDVIELKNNHINLPIIIFSPLSNEEIEICIDHNVELTIHSLDMLKNVEEISKKFVKTTKIHLNMDLKMGRTGIRKNDLLELYSCIDSLENITVSGIYTHFPESDYPNDQLGVKEKMNTLNQINEFNQIIQKITEKIDRKSLLIHAANSGAVLNEIRGSFFDIVRIGIAFYGFYPSYGQFVHCKHRLKPALVLKTKIIHLKTIQKGDAISYGRTWIAEKEERIASLGVGYASGLARVLSNKGYVIINGRYADIVGKILMENSMVQVRVSCKVGDEVIVFESIDEVASMIETVPHEILCNIPEKIQRIWLEEID